MMFEGKKPKKNPKLTVINYLGAYYGTVDGEHLYQVDPLAVGLLKYCDGKRTFEEIVELLAKKTGIPSDKIKPVIERILKEMTEMKFIVWD